MLRSHTLSYLRRSILGGGGGGGAADPNYRYYQVDITAVDGGTLVSGAEMEWAKRDAASAPNVCRQSVTPGTASASSTFGSLDEIGAANAFAHRFVFTDGNPNGWVANSLASGWLQWEDDGTRDVVGAALTARPGEGARMPKDFQFLYGPNAGSLSVARSITGETGWPSMGTRYFSWASVGAQKIWRLNVDAIDGGDMLGLCSMRLVCADGTVINNSGRVFLARALTRFGGAFEEAELFDGSAASFENCWISGVDTTETIIVHPPMPMDLVEMRWTAQPEDPNRSPKDFTIRKSADITFATSELLKTVTGSTGWTGGQQRAWRWDEGAYDETEIAAIFSGGAEGLWYAPYDFDTLFQDTAGTIPVTDVDQPVGKMLDKSGRGHHATAPSDAARPTLRIGADGRHYLQFDGSDDRMNIAGTLDATTSTMAVAGSRRTTQSSYRTCLKINKQALMVNMGASNNWGGYNNAELLSGYDAGPRGIWVMRTVAYNDVDLFTDTVSVHDMVTRTNGTAFNSYTPQLGADAAGTQFADLAFYGAVVTLAEESDAVVNNIREYLSEVCDVPIA